MQTILRFAFTFLIAILGTAPWARAADPGQEEFSSLNDIVAVLPHEILVGLTDNVGKEKAAASGTEVFHQNVAGKMATLKMKINTVKKEGKPYFPKDRFVIQAVEESSRAGAVTFKNFPMIYLNESEDAKAAALHKGNEITVTGKITYVDIRVIRASASCHINLHLSDAVIK